MTKKSAAQMKLVDGGGKLPPIEDVFANQKKGMLATIEIQIKQDLRFDTMMSVRETYLRFYRDQDEMDLDYASRMCHRIEETHRTIRCKINDLELEDIVSEKFTNPCDTLVDFRAPENWKDVFEQSIMFSAVQPYGQAFDDLHARMMEEVSKRDA